MDAQVEHVERVDGRAHVEWSPTATYWKAELKVTKPESGRVFFEDCEILRTESYLRVYRPKLGIVIDSPKQRGDSLPYKILDCLVPASWFTAFPHSNQAWSELMDVSLGGAAVKQVGIIEQGDGLVTFTREFFDEGFSYPQGKEPLTITVDLQQQALVQSAGYPPYTYQGNSSPGRSGEWEWTDDGSGALRLKKLRCIDYPRVKTEPCFEIQIAVTQFNPQERPAPTRFAPGSFQIPDGTEIRRINANPGVKPDSVIQGGGKKRIPKAVLDSVIQDARQRGFSSESRERK